MSSHLTDGHPSFFPFCGLCVASGTALANELVTKQVCKRTMSAKLTSRPPEAVCKKPGMPSGHAMTAYTLIVWVLLEVAFDHVVQTKWAAMVVLLMGPVPWARVYNMDHTVLQVTTA